MLQGAGWIRLCGQTKGTVGRRATTYELDERSAFVVSVNLGGTKVNVALASRPEPSSGERDQIQSAGQDRARLR